MHRHTTRPARMACVLTFALAACSSADEPPPSGAPSASEPGSAPAAASAVPSEALSAVEPRLVAEGVVSSDDEEYRLSLTSDGQTAYFARGGAFFPQSRQASIYETSLDGGAWSEPIVTAFSGSFPDIDPWVSADGQSIYFSSIRPVAGEDRTDAELFRVDRAGDGWSEPVHLSVLGSPADELGASVAADGTIWFASDRSGSGWDLYSASPSGEGFEEPVAAENLNTSVWEFNPAISADGTILLFTSISRPGGSGLGDLFASTRDGDAWSEPQPLSLNSPADEYHPSLSPDGETLYFVRRAADGDLFEVPWATVAPDG